MKLNAFFALALLCLAATRTQAQSLDEAAPEKPKGSTALTISMGNSSTLFTPPSNVIPAPSYLRSQRTLSVGLQFIRPNNNRHILSLDTELFGVVRSANGNVISRPTAYIGYEFRRYIDLGSPRVQLYTGAWAQAGAAVGVSSFGSDYAVSARLGVGLGAQYNITDRLFVEGGMRFGVLEAGANNAPITPWTAEQTGLQFNLGRSFESRIGLGVKF